MITGTTIYWVPTVYQALVHLYALALNSPGACAGLPQPVWHPIRCCPSRPCTPRLGNPSPTRLGSIWMWYLCSLWVYFTIGMQLSEVKCLAPGCYWAEFEPSSLLLKASFPALLLQVFLGSQERAVFLCPRLNWLFLSSFIFFSVSPCLMPEVAISLVSGDFGKNDLRFHPVLRQCLLSIV